MSETSKQPLARLEDLLTAHERQGVLLETIDDKLEHAMAMDAGELRDSELQNCWLLLWTAREIHDRHFREIGDVVEALYQARRLAAA